MPSLTGPRLFRFLLFLVVRLRRSVRVIALALRARLASFWKSIFVFQVAPRCNGQCQIPLVHANDVPRPGSVTNSGLAGERVQTSESARVEEGGSKCLPALHVRGHGIAHWQEKLARYQAQTPKSYPVKFPPHPTIPERGSQRYKLRTVRQTTDSIEVPAGQQELLFALPSLPSGWRRHVHPEGNVFFYHAGLRIFTECNIVERETEVLLGATTLIQRAIETSGVDLDEFTEIVLNVDVGQRWYYYFVDHTNRLLFWLDPVNSREHLGANLQVVIEHGHIRYLVESQYWTHCEYYPHNCALLDGVFTDLRGMLNYAKTDMMTGDSFTSPFAEDELVAILDIVNSLKDDKISDTYSIWVIARLMSFFTETKFLNFCGQSCARLRADTPLFGQQTWNRSKLFKFLNAFLFGSPSEHASRLQRVWVDGIIIQPRWKGFINRLTTELGRYTIFSTVMLAVNFSFLAVPGVVTPGTPASTIQVLIYCSVVSTTGSIVFSFALMNVYSDPGLLDASPAAEVMKILSQTTRGMAALAITHSLPIASLVWSIALFSVALAIQIFSPKQPATVATLSVEYAIFMLFGLISYFVMRLFSKNDDIGNVGASEEKDTSPTVSQDDDVERGPA